MNPAAYYTLCMLPDFAALRALCSKVCTRCTFQLPPPRSVGTRAAFKSAASCSNDARGKCGARCSSKIRAACRSAISRRSSGDSFTRDCGLGSSAGFGLGRAGVRPRPSPPPSAVAFNLDSARSGLRCGLAARAAGLRGWQGLQRMPVHSSCRWWQRLPLPVHAAGPLPAPPAGLCKRH